MRPAALAGVVSRNPVVADESAYEASRRVNGSPFALSHGPGYAPSKFTWQRTQSRPRLANIGPVIHSVLSTVGMGFKHGVVGARAIGGYLGCRLLEAGRTVTGPRRPRHSQLRISSSDAEGRCKAPRRQRY